MWLACFTWENGSALSRVCLPSVCGILSSLCSGGLRYCNFAVPTSIGLLSRKKRHSWQKKRGVTLRRSARWRSPAFSETRLDQRDYRYLIDWHKTGRALLPFDYQLYFLSLQRRLLQNSISFHILTAGTSHCEHRFFQPENLILRSCIVLEFVARLQPKRFNQYPGVYLFIYLSMSGVSDVVILFSWVHLHKTWTLEILEMLIT